MYNVCKRCLMDNASDKTIKFDSEGYCNYCSDVIKRMPSEYFPDKTERKLNEIFQKIKQDCANDKYDCMVGVSGGLDSSYILYLGYKYGLRMLAVHIDDGLDNPIAVENLKSLMEKTGTKLITIKPNQDEYSDVMYALFKASVPNLAIAQDNLILKALQDYGEKNKIKYILDGSNFAHESILERDKYGVNTCDSKYIKGVHKTFGRIPLKETKFMSLTDRYLKRRANRKFKHIRPLNYIEYNMNNAITTLEAFCNFKYYGGKHYESILTRYMQLYYLPTKFGIDKRKSHFSSLIVSGQMSRQEALDQLKKPLEEIYDLRSEDEKMLAKYMGISDVEFANIFSNPPKRETDYRNSLLNKVAPIARKLRHFFE